MPIPGIEELVIYQKYFERDFARMLRKFLPRGYVWRIPLPREDDIRASSIRSTESFGLLTIPSFAGSIELNGNGIVTAEVMGIPIAIGFGLYMTGIVSAEALGVPDVGRQELSGVGIASEEVWGFPTVVYTPQFIESNSIISTEGWGAPLVLDVLIADSFQSSLSSGWDSGFLTNWYQTIEDGEGIAQRASEGWDRLFPQASDVMTGDFDIFYDYWRSASEPGNDSIHLEFYNFADALQFSTEYWGEHARGVKEASSIGEINTSPSTAIPMRIQRISGTIWVYTWDGSSWVRADNWVSLGGVNGTSYSNSEDVYIKADGGDGINGFARIVITGTILPPT